eukprot:sb/3464301/
MISLPTATTVDDYRILPAITRTPSQSILPARTHVATTQSSTQSVTMATINSAANGDSSTVRVAEFIVPPPPSRSPSPAVAISLPPPPSRSPSPAVSLPPHPTRSLSPAVSLPPPCRYQFPSSVISSDLLPIRSPASASPAASGPPHSISSDLLPTHKHLKGTKPLVTKVTKPVVTMVTKPVEDKYPLDIPHHGSPATARPRTTPGLVEPGEIDQDADDVVKWSNVQISPSLVTRKRITDSLLSADVVKLPDSLINRDKKKPTVFFNNTRAVSPGTIEQGSPKSSGDAFRTPPNTRRKIRFEDETESMVTMVTMVTMASPVSPATESETPKHPGFDGTSLYTNESDSKPGATARLGNCNSHPVPASPRHQPSSNYGRNTNQNTVSSAITNNAYLVSVPGATSLNNGNHLTNATTNHMSVPRSNGNIVRRISRQIMELPVLFHHTKQEESVPEEPNPFAMFDLEYLGYEGRKEGIRRVI